jgi:hypothetical protein
MEIATLSVNPCVNKGNYMGRPERIIMCIRREVPQSAISVLHVLSEEKRYFLGDISRTNSQVLCSNRIRHLMKAIDLIKNDEIEKGGIRARKFVENDSWDVIITKFKKNITGSM